MVKIHQLSLCLYLLPTLTSGFTTKSSSRLHPRLHDCHQFDTVQSLQTEDGFCEQNMPDSAILNHRRAVIRVAANIVLTTIATIRPSHVLAAQAARSIPGSSPDHPVVILGGGGRLGIEVARALATAGLYGVTMTRTAKDPGPLIAKQIASESSMSYLTHYPEPVNVLDQEGLDKALAAVQPSAIVYCASASRQGGTAAGVDDLGVGYAASAASSLKARLIFVSALAVTRPDSQSYQMTNTIGGNYNGIMTAKAAGENKVRAALKDYIILRPGVLMSGKSRYAGSARGLTLNQGDTVAGGLCLTRDELAAIVVGALQTPRSCLTVEAYRKETAQKLQPEFIVPSGNEVYSESFVGLFDGVKLDKVNSS